MGQEARCVVRVWDRVSEGKARLETDELVFRGDDGLRLTIPFKEMRVVAARNGELRADWTEGAVVFDLGAQAEKWAQKILHPKSLLDKLGVRAAMRVLVLGVEDDGFLADLLARTDSVVLGEASYSVPPEGESLDIVFIAVDGPADMIRLADLKRAIKPNGAVWAVFRKGRKDFNENDVLRGGLAAGLVDVKVVRFSDTHTAMKLVIQKAERA